MQSPFHLIFLLHCTFAYKILIFAPVISRSHLLSNARIADTLASAKHDVVMFEPNFMHIFDISNTTKVARRWQVDGFSTVLIDWIKDRNLDSFKETSAIKTNIAYLQFSIRLNKLCEELTDRDDVMTKLKAEQFDGIFSKQLHQQNFCGSGLAHALGIKSQFLVSGLPMTDTMAWTLGMPNPTSYVPSSYELSVGSRMTYMERIYNLWYSTVFILFAKYPNYQLTNIFRRKFGADFPSVEKLAADSDLVFLTTEDVIDFPRPTLSNVIHIGGLCSESDRMKLNEPFASEMQKGSDGVVYFSLGTNVNTTILPRFAMKTVIETAAKFKSIHFIIKVDKTDQWSRKLTENMTNVYFANWVPQPAILAHDRLRVFITHGGYNGIVEAARAAVPMIAIPFMFDQIRNSRAIAERGCGLALKRQFLRDDPIQLETAIREVLENKKYKGNARRISNLISSKPFNANEKLVKYTEYVLKNNGVKELLVEGRNINFITYFNLDIIVPLVSFIFVVSLVCFKLMLYFINRIVLTKKVKMQ